MYHVGTAAEFVAFHIMPGHDGPEGTRHSHDYRLDVVLDRSVLDSNGMVCDLDELHAAIDTIVETVSGKNLELVVSSESDAAVTVEVFARWSHAQVAAALAASGVDQIHVRIYENPVAFGGYSAPPG
jgi:6-pyruvoyltetrahydropterin/6-carboxytetrahydropterin synthase